MPPNPLLNFLWEANPLFILEKKEPIDALEAFMFFPILEKAAMAEFGSADSGASLGDILGAALSKAKKKVAKAEDKEEAEEQKPAKAKKTTKKKAAEKEETPAE